MGAGASANPVAGVPQGIDTRRSNMLTGALQGLIGSSQTQHYKFALVNSEMLKDRYTSCYTTHRLASLLQVTLYFARHHELSILFGAFRTVFMILKWL